jgi:hypothetical protein
MAHLNLSAEFSFERLSNLVFTEPTGVVFHYTSLSGFQQIVRSGKMYASDIRYLNDATEMTHALRLVQDARERRLRAIDDIKEAGGNISSMLDPSLPDHMLMFDLDEQVRGAPCYVTCFTKEGNQLSQWRGYCPPHKGISIGFLTSDLRASAKTQWFALRECIYDPQRQTLVGDSLLSALKWSEESRNAKRRTQLYSAFQQIAAVLKHPRFGEERECRLISTEWHTDNPRLGIEHREGKTMLIPYCAFDLPRDEHGRLKIARVIVGPTPHAYQALFSVSQFLVAQNAADHIGNRVEYCDIPLRDA